MRNDDWHLYVPCLRQHVSFLMLLCDCQHCCDVEREEEGEGYGGGGDAGHAIRKP